MVNIMFGENYDSLSCYLCGLEDLEVYFLCDIFKNKFFKDNF